MILLYDDYSHFIVLSSHNICILYSIDIISGANNQPVMMESNDNGKHSEKR